MKETPDDYVSRKPYRNMDAMRYAIDALRMKVLRKPVLVAGPYVGEFGHEIMDWQSYVRALRASYREVHVITYPGREALYKGCVVHAHDIRLENAGYFYGNMPVREIEAYARRVATALGLTDYDLFHTGHLCTRYHRRILWRQKHECLVEPVSIGRRRDVIFHFRQVDKAGPDKTKNYDPVRAEKLFHLCRTEGITSACIGHPKYSFCPEGCEDLRSDNLAATISAIGSSTMVVGECSGPIHLAMYCAKPVVIWASHWWGPKSAYERNPFNVNISVISDQTTQVEPLEVLAGIQAERVRWNGAGTDGSGAPGRRGC